MTQLFANAARAELAQAISELDTSLTIESGGSLFPVATTGNAAIGPSGDWFRLVIQNEAGDFEVMYCRSHSAGSNEFGDLLRGQEGTLALAFPMSSVVGNRPTAGNASEWEAKQDKLISGNNIKTINGESLLGSGNLELATSLDAIQTPENLSPTNNATEVVLAEFLGSPYYGLYGKAHSSLQVRMSLQENFSSTLWDSGEVAGALTGLTGPSLAGLVPTSTRVYWQLRYKNEANEWSEWSSATSFVSAAQYISYIPTPAPTPANYGDPFEGGFYAGLFWNQIARSSSSKTLQTGTQTFTVPDMTTSPIVYEGQLLEVRSRANPNNKFIGTVTGAAGTTLTLNVSSIQGSGTFSDWSIMSRFRSINAPKASGEIASIALKNANTAFPTACQTLTEGWEATLAMVAAGDATEYPAAHAVRAMVINGKDDWYIPARDQRELDWRNLKPVTDNNYVTANRPTAAAFNYANDGSYGDTANTHGVNNNSSPTGSDYTASVPAQTAATTFRTGGAEAFDFGSSYYWTSSEYDASHAWLQYWDSSAPGLQSSSGGSYALRLRAVRRSII
jgi:hypothetical protein